MHNIICLVRKLEKAGRIVAVGTGNKALPLGPTKVSFRLDGHSCSLTVKKHIDHNRNVWLHASLRCNGEEVDVYMRVRLESNPHLCLDLQNACFCINDRGSCECLGPGDPDYTKYIKYIKGKGSGSLASGLLLAAALCSSRGSLNEECLTAAAPLLVAELPKSHEAGLLEAACREAHRADPSGAALAERLLQALHGAKCKPPGLRLLWAAAHIEEQLGLGASIRKLYEDVLLGGYHTHHAAPNKLLKSLVEAAWLGDINGQDAYEIIGIATRNKNADCRLEPGPPPRLICGHTAYMLSTTPPP